MYLRRPCRINELVWSLCTSQFHHPKNSRQTPSKLCAIDLACVSTTKCRCVLVVCLDVVVSSEIWPESADGKSPNDVAAKTLGIVETSPPCRQLSPSQQRREWFRSHAKRVSRRWPAPRALAPTMTLQWRSLVLREWQCSPNDWSERTLAGFSSETLYAMPAEAFQLSATVRYVAQTPASLSAFKNGQPPSKRCFMSRPHSDARRLSGTSQASSAALSARSMAYASIILNETHAIGSSSAITSQ